MTKQTVRRHLKKLRAECIEGTDDVILKRIAYSVEQGIRLVTEKTVGWPSLVQSVRDDAELLKRELSL